MTESEERILASGKNYEHTGGAVHTSKIELLFQVKEGIIKAERDIIQENPSLDQVMLPTNVSDCHYFLLFIVQFSAKDLPQMLLREKVSAENAEIAKAISSESNFSRYCAIIDVMNKNPDLLNLMQMDRKVNRKSSKWNIDKVCCFYLYCVIFCHKII